MEQRVEWNIRSRGSVTGEPEEGWRERVGVRFEVWCNSWRMGSEEVKQVIRTEDTEKKVCNIFQRKKGRNRIGMI